MAVDAARPQPALLSVVAPVFDERPTVDEFHARVCAALADRPFELVLVDDGSDIVYAVRRRRAGERRFKLATARLFYRVFRRLTSVDLPPDSGDFRLLDRRPLDALLAMRERARFLRGMTAWVGYDQASVEYRDRRLNGETKYTLRRMLSLSLDASPRSPTSRCSSRHGSASPSRRSRASR